jgi:SAM-dependent methyltransferase
MLVYRQVRRVSAEGCVGRAATNGAIRTLNTVCPYYTMFPLEFPLQRLARARPDEWVLDPFCGRGTTIFAARLRRLRCVGIDSNPIAAAIAAAKLVDTTPEDIIECTRAILEGSREPTAVPEGPFWRMCFHPKTLREICVLREHLLEACRSDEEIALRALMLGILHGPKRRAAPTYLSNQMPRTYATKPDAAIRFWKERGLTSPPVVDVLDAISRRARHTFASLPPPVSGEVRLGDARRADQLLPTGRRYSWVITSPPYFGMRTYRPDQWLRNWFVGGEPRVDYTQEGQLIHHVDKFADELAAVWRAVARRCRPGAHLTVRFGYLPSIPIDARDLLRLSFDRADAGWRLTRWADAGSSSNGRRQSQQFRRSVNDAACEVDAYARLEV